MRRFALILVAALAACGTKPPQELSEWERRNLQLPVVEEESRPPAYPEQRNLVEFRVPSADGFRFFIDRPSLAVTKDGVVRYVLVARSPDGVENVTFEGLRCTSAEERVYAVGRPDGTWSPAQSAWRPVATPRHATLAIEYFCPQKEPIRDAAEGLRALEAGGHPFAKGFGNDVGRSGR